MNVNKLKGKIVEKGMNVEMLADEVGCDRATMYRWLSNIEKVTCGAAVKIKNVLDLTNSEAVDIFLS